MLVFAHRGASGYAPENTLKAMDLAMQLGAAAVELDVHNVEGELMVFHDRRLEGKSNGMGLIHHKTQTELAAFSVKGEPIPSLWQVLELLAGRCIVNIELKGVRTWQPMVALYQRAIGELGFRPEQLLISSFHHPDLAAFKAAVPQARIAPLLGSLPLDGASIARQMQAYSLHLDVSFISRQIVDDAHDAGVKVYVYTVDDTDDIRALAAIGVDGIFANYPDKAAAALTETGTKDYHGWFE